MSDFMASVGNGKYSISYKTTSAEDFELLRTMCRYFSDRKAIPIEWIEKWMLDNWELECNYGIEQMIEDWEQENEHK